jgi:hypothetical protein
MVREIVSRDTKQRRHPAQLLPLVLFGNPAAADNLVVRVVLESGTVDVESLSNKGSDSERDGRGGRDVRFPR